MILINTYAVPREREKIHALLHNFFLSKMIVMVSLVGVLTCLRAVSSSDWDSLQATQRLYYLDTIAAVHYSYSLRFQFSLNPSPLPLISISGFLLCCL